MTNTALFFSASAAACLHLLGIVYAPGMPWPFLANILLGSATSVANHLLTSPRAQRLDRAAMCVGLPITAYYAPNWQFHISLGTAAGLYLISKRLRSTPLHILAHATITATHLGILASLPASALAPWYE